MGLETTCRVRVTDAGGSIRAANAKVLLETDELIVRGEARIRIPRASIQRVAVRAGVLTVGAPSATVSLSLGPETADKWRKKLTEPPKALIDKLGVRSGVRVWAVGDIDETLMMQVAERTENIRRGRSATDCDVVFVALDSPRDFGRIDRAAAAIADTGAIWTVHRKGSSGISDTLVIAHARSIGLVDTKVARISDTHTAEKFVRPVASRTKSK